MVLLMFRPGKRSQQKSLFDYDISLSPAMQKMLNKSWAGNFFETIFLAIHEERFSVLYSEKISRPNKPINFLVSLLLLKEVNQLTDEELLESLAFDFRFHYALGIQDIERERVCINTLTHFRKRLVEHEISTGENLLQKEVESLSKQLADCVQLDRSMARMDSMMVSSSCKLLTRLELVFTVIQNMVHTMKKLHITISEEFAPYLEVEHKNTTLYKTRTDVAQTRTDFLFQQASTLYDAILKEETLKTTEAFCHLERLLNEQCVVTEGGVRVPISSKKVGSTSLQNPSDPDATFRTKGKKTHTGYVANLVEVRDKEKKIGLILHHDVQPNVHSDAEFGETFVENHPLVEEINTLVADGAYYRVATVQKAEEKEIEFNVSSMTGGTISDDRLLVSEFKINEKTNKVETCPAGNTPLYSEYQVDKEVYRAKFAKPDCAQCQLLSRCPIQIKQEMNTLRFTEKKLQADRMRTKMGTEQQRLLANFRAGVEGLPSVLRRVYRIDQMPIRGLVRSKIWIACKIMAHNVKQVVRYTQLRFLIYDFLYFKEKIYQKFISLKVELC